MSLMSFPRDVRPDPLREQSLPCDEQRALLDGAARLNAVSGIAGTMFRRIVPHAIANRDRPLRVLDIASGCGDLPIQWATMARARGLALQITTIDNSPVAIDQQNKVAHAAGVTLVCLQRDCLRDSLPNGFDVVTCSLFMHQLNDLQVIRLLQSMQSSTSGVILISDLERSRVNLSLMRVASRCVSRSPVMHQSATQSVCAAYTRHEFSRLAQTALLRPVRCQRLLSCRFLLSVEDKVQTVPVASPAFA